MSKPKIGIVIGSTREGRFADKPANWIYEIARARGDIEVELIDLRDFPLPFFDEPASPAWAPSRNEIAQKWQKKVASFDGFVFTAAEYNRGPTAVLKNAIDYAYTEWNKKAVGFVGYGGVGGARAVEQLRLIAIETQMAPVRAGVHIAWADMLPVMQGQKKLEEYEHLKQAAGDMLDQVAWWTKALVAARRSEAAEAAIAA
jgi:NAD(P)H-dependent FMN reductase